MINCLLAQKMAFVEYFKSSFTATVCSNFYARKQLLLLALLANRNSVCVSVCPSVRHTGGSVKSGASYNQQIFTVAAWKTLVSGTVKLFHKFERGHSERKR